MYVQVCHDGRRPVRVNCAPSLHELIHYLGRTGNKQLRPERLSIDEIAISFGPCAICQPLFLLRKVKHVSDQWEWLRSWRVRKRATRGMSFESSEDEKASDGAGKVRCKAA
jgi:hypothetical protein